MILLKSLLRINRADQILRNPVLIKSADWLNDNNDHSVSKITALVHEIRNPLSTIKMATELLREENPKMDKLRFLDMIDRASSRIQSLLSELLATNTLQPGQSEICFLHEVLDEVLALTEDRIFLKEVQVCKKYEAANSEISIGKNNMIIALSNIIVNAIEAMPNGSGKLGLQTKSYQDHLVLKIIDNGIGIKQEDLSDMFIPYYSSKPDGLGLGLSTTLDILDAGNSTLEVESEPGIGTVFTLSFNRKI